MPGRQSGANTEMSDVFTQMTGKTKAGTFIEKNVLRLGGEYRNWTIWGFRAVIIVGFLALWEWASGRPGADPWVLIDEFYVSKPSQILASIQLMIERGILWRAMLDTLYTTLLGFIIGAIGGWLLGIVLGMNRFLGDALNPIIAALYAIPRLALIPVFIIWFGIGRGAIVGLITSIVFFLVFYNTFLGVRDVERRLIDALRFMGASKLDIIMKVTMPSAMNWIIAGLRISVPYALVAAVTGEMMAGSNGMGYVLMQASSQFNTAGVFAAITVLMIIALILDSLVTFVERHALKWKIAALGFGEAK